MSKNHVTGIKIFITNLRLSEGSNTGSSESPAYWAEGIWVHQTGLLQRQTNYCPLGVKFWSPETSVYAAMVLVLCAEPWVLNSGLE